MKTATLANKITALVGLCFATMPVDVRWMQIALEKRTHLQWNLYALVAPYSCQVAPETVVVRGEWGTACKDNQCDPGTGICAMTPINSNGLCEDGNFCTLADTCVGGECVAGAPPNCDDGNVCTNDSCDAATGACINTPNDVACDDGTACTFGDVCLNAVCDGVDVDCEDGNPCTSSNCDPAAGCTWRPDGPGLR